MAEKTTYKELEKRVQEFERVESDHKKTEMALRESEKQYHHIFDNISDLIMIHDLRGRLLSVNPTVSKLSGYTTKELLGQSLGDFVAPQSRNLFYDFYLKQVKEQGISEGVYIGQAKNGTEYYIEYRNVLVRPEIGEPYVFGIGRDISERKKSEEILLLSKQKLDLHFLQTPLAVIEWNLDFKVRSWNPAAEIIFGYTEKEILNTHASIIIPDQYKNQVDAIWAGLLQQKGGSRSTNENLTKKGDIIFCEWFNTPIINETGDTIAVFSLVQNITSRMQAEKEKNKLQSQLQQSQRMESIGTLAGGIAHDFNNILFPILGNTELLFMDIKKDSPVYQRLERIYAGANRAKELVKQILTFARQEENEIQLMKMQPIIKEALKLIRSTIPTTIEIKQNLQSDCGAIKADPTQIHQIIMNLITNAYHAMEKIGGELNIRLKEVKLGESDLFNADIKSGTYVRLSISDTGKGMDKDTIKKIFDPFFTTKETGKGTGMGLSVVHGIVKNMNGTIKVYSEPVKGTEFHVYLPLAEEEKKQKITNVDIPILGGTEHILLVDDEKTIIEMEQDMLERLGYKVTLRSRSIEALEAFRASPDKFDLVITDMAMPNMPGDKLSIALNKILPGIPILLCTGFSETMTEEMAESLGIKGFLLKPIVMRDLAHKIREVLDEK